MNNRIVKAQVLLAEAVSSPERIAVSSPERIAVSSPERIAVSPMEAAGSPRSNGASFIFIFTNVSVGRWALIKFYRPPHRSKIKAKLLLREHLHLTASRGDPGHVGTRISPITYCENHSPLKSKRSEESRAAGPRPERGGAAVGLLYLQSHDYNCIKHT